MHASINWPRIEEPFHRTLARNVTIATVVAAVLTVLRHDFTWFLPVTALALWPSLGGHYVELAFVNGIRDRIPRGQFAQVLVRLLVWFVGGALLSCGMAVTFLPVRALPYGLWLWGGLLFIGLELVVHALLAARCVDSFYNGRG
jgi:hypothetical protein